MKYLLFFFILIFSGCSHHLGRSFTNLSKPEKTWVFFHPFKAKKAYYTTKNVEFHVDSIGKYGTIGNDNHGGHLDAFKHSYWMARLTQEVGKHAANSLGRAHEKGNYKMYKSGHFEDGTLPDRIASLMDLYNNHVGISVGTKMHSNSQITLTTVLIDSLMKGKLRILNKDSLGNFLDCNQQIIVKDSLKKWSTEKCLVPSNFYFPNH